MEPQDTQPENVSLNLKFIHEEAVSMQVSKDINILALKQQICATTGKPVDTQRLIYKGKVMRDSMHLHDYSFIDGDTIHVVTSQPLTASEEPSVPPPSSIAAQSSSSLSSPESLPVHESFTANPSEQSNAQQPTQPSIFNGVDSMFIHVMEEQDLNADDFGSLIENIIHHTAAGPSATVSSSSSSSRHQPLVFQRSTINLDLRPSAAASTSADSFSSVPPTSASSEPNAHVPAVHSEAESSSTSTTTQRLHQRAVALRQDASRLSELPMLSFHAEHGHIISTLNEFSQSLIHISRHLTSLAWTLNQAPPPLPTLSSSSSRLSSSSSWQHPHPHPPPPSTIVADPTLQLHVQTILGMLRSLGVVTSDMIDTLERHPLIHYDHRLLGPHNPIPSSVSSSASASSSSQPERRLPSMHSRPPQTHTQTMPPLPPSPPQASSARFMSNLLHAVGNAIGGASSSSSSSSEPSSSSAPSSSSSSFSQGGVRIHVRHGNTNVHVPPPPNVPQNHHHDSHPLPTHVTPLSSDLHPLAQFFSTLGSTIAAASSSNEHPPPAAAATVTTVTANPHWTMTSAPLSPFLDIVRKVSTKYVLYIYIFIQFLQSWLDVTPGKRPEGMMNHDHWIDGRAFYLFVQSNENSCVLPHTQAEADRQRL